MPTDWNRDDTQASSSAELRAAFTSFIGQTFFGQLLHAMRTSLGEPAYFHGGQAEEIFQSQLDQVLAERLTERSAETFAEPLFAQQFPQLAKSLAATPSRTERPPSLADLEGLQSY